MHILWLSLKNKNIKKKLIVILFLYVNICCQVFSEPADPTPRKVIQPNGDTISISLHGDEYGSWYEDAKGDIISLNSDNYWVYVSVENGNMIQTYARGSKDEYFKFGFC